MYKPFKPLEETYITCSKCGKIISEQESLNGQCIQHSNPKESISNEEGLDEFYTNYDPQEYIYNPEVEDYTSKYSN